LENLQNYNIKN